ncbi:MAG: NUDIX domain-containing protein [Gammaproteobacteria bacterium]
MTTQLPELHVVAAVLQRDNQYFIQQRPPGKHMAGLWEFAGGKVEQGESAWAALVRELNEELGIQATRGEPLIQLRHAYPDRIIDLDVWRVTEWVGEPVAQEQQVTGWFSLHDILTMPLLPADGPVLTAMSLPHSVLVTPTLVNHSQFFEQLKESVTRHQYTLCLLRQQDMLEKDYRLLATQACEVLDNFGCALILEGVSDERVGLASELGIERIHVEASSLEHIGQYNHVKWSADCSSVKELDLAVAAGVDFAILNLVNESAERPEWAAFRDAISTRNIPVFALGGMDKDDEVRSRLEGAQGIALNRW